jgi:hypothetical protein
MLTQTIEGHGTMTALTIAEYNGLLDFAPHVQSQIRAYTEANHNHRAAIVVLPETARPLGGTRASTYADNPTRFLAFDTKREWLIANFAQAPAATPQHLILMSHDADVFTALHEVTHLADFDKIYDHIAATGKPHLLRMDAFTIFSELHAYQVRLRAILKENSASLEEAAGGLSRDLKNQIGPAFAALDPATRAKYEAIAGLAGQSQGDYRAFLLSNEPLPAWSEILKKLPTDIFKEYRP